MAINDELARVNKVHGKSFNSPHEAAAVMYEELEEAMHEGDMFKHMLMSYWECVKKDDEAGMEMFLREMLFHSKRSIEEWIQVAAMCLKGSA